VIRRVEISKLAAKQLRKVPKHIVDNLIIWVAAIELDGLEEVRKVPGYHDDCSRAFGSGSGRFG
jgi:proteic killer suppression protein